MYTYGIADNSGDSEADFLGWKKDLWKNVCKHLPELEPEIIEENLNKNESVGQNEKGESAKSSNSANQYVLTETKENLDSPIKSIPKDFRYQKYFDSKKATIMSIKELRQIVTESLSSVEIMLKLPENESYQTAQNIILFPKNTVKTVLKILYYLKSDGKQFLQVNPKFSIAAIPNFNVSFPINKKLNTIIWKHIDIKSPIK